MKKEEIYDCEYGDGCFMLSDGYCCPDDSGCCPGCFPDGCGGFCYSCPDED